MSLFYLGANVIQFGLLRRPSTRRATEYGSACGGAFQNTSAVEGCHDESLQSLSPGASGKRVTKGIHPCSSALHPKRTGIRSILAAKPPRVSLNLLQRQSVLL